MPEESILPVKNTFVHFEKTDPQLPRSQSAPAIMTTQPNPEELKTIKQKLQELNKGKTITREQLETHTTPKAYFTDELEQYFRLYGPINGETITIPCYAAPLEEPQKKLYQDENTEILAE